MKRKTAAKSPITQLKCLSMAMVLLFSTGVLTAQTWKTQNDNQNWGTASNWSPATVPNQVGATATLGDIIQAARTINVNNTYTIGTLNISSRNNYTLKNGTLIFDVPSGSAALNVSNSGSPTILSNIQANDPFTINQNGTGLLTIGGNINYQYHNLKVTGSGDTRITGAISGGFNGFTKEGTGTLTLAGSNTFNGPLKVNQGVVVAAHNNALGTSSWDNAVASGAALHLSGASIAQGNISLAGQGVGGTGALRAVSGTNSWSGTVTAAAPTTIGADAGASLNLTGPLAAQNNVTFTGAGNFTVSGDVYGLGVVQKTGSGTLTLSGNSKMNNARLDVLEGTVELNKELNNSQDPIIGTTSGPAATLRLMANNRIRDDMFVTVKESGTFDLNNKNDGIAGLKLYGGNVQTGTGTLTIANAGGDKIHAYASNQTAKIGGKLASNLAQGLTITVEDGSQATDLDISAAFSGNVARVHKKGTGTLEYSGNVANTYTGVTEIHQGTLKLNKTAGTDAIAGSSIKINSGGTLLLNSKNQIKDTTTLTLAGGTFSTGLGVGNDEKLGALTLTSNSRIELGSGVHLLEFANSSALSDAWTGTLTIYGWTGDALGGTQGQIYFGNNSMGLTSSQLSQISFDGFGMGAAILANGQIVPIAVIPEAEVIWGTLLLAGGIVWYERNRLRKMVMRLLR